MEKIRNIYKLSLKNITIIYIIFNINALILTPPLFFKEIFYNGN